MKALFLALLFIFCHLTAVVAADIESHVGDDSHGEMSTEEKSESQLTMITEKFGVQLPTLFAQILNFCIVAYVLYRFAVKPIVATLDERQQKIADGLQYAEEMKNQLAKAERERAEKIKEAATEAQRIMSEARGQSKEYFEQKHQEAGLQAEAIIRKANEATVLEREKMLSEVRKEVARLVVSTSSKVLNRELSDDEKRLFSDSAARELASSSA